MITVMNALLVNQATELEIHVNVLLVFMMIKIKLNVKNAVLPVKLVMKRVLAYNVNYLILLEKVYYANVLHLISMIKLMTSVNNVSKAVINAKITLHV